ncbi:hypothetical protein Nepgr_011186 [Nepenthes gracilis]|uniref:Protein kinase domain-containing protein n=1 Tax=Nepenthes gracilis TaxID=150966 RepID=A0AAD3XM26_NEPGR|nr:hypothetical protein Nepgr_011186 [Nepenthes gracilis]
MEQFRHIGEVLGSLNAMMVLRDDIQINQRQCCLLFDMFDLAFKTISEEIKKNLKLEENCTKWKTLEQPLRELYRVFKEGELYVRACLDTENNWWAKALTLHDDKDCVEFHVHNLLCYFPVVIEAIETAGEISGLDLDEMQKRRIMLAKKYDKVWNDPKLFQWNYGRQYLVPQEICHRLNRATREDKWLLQETIREKKNLQSSNLTKHEQRLGDLLVKKLEGSESLFPRSILTAAKDYQVRRRLEGGSQYKEIQWLGKSFVLRHFFGETAALNPQIFSLLSLSHPNVIKYLCGFHEEEKKEYFLVMELMSKDLSTYIKEICGPKRRLPFSLPVAVDIMLQIARGMEYLHSRKIYHGDLNPSDILIKSRSSSMEGYVHVKISGFGLRSVKNVPSRSSSPNQSEMLGFIWHAPEVLAEQEKPGRSCDLKYSEKADVYSFAMLCFELLTGKVPFDDGHLQGDKMSRNIRAGERPLFPFPLPKFLATLMKRCWQTDPIQRPSFSSICRILRYIKRLIIINPHLIHPEILSPQVDVCDIEARFMEKFPVNLAPVTQIPFQLFAYRLAEKEKLSGSDKPKNWESASEKVPSEENISTADDVFVPIRDTRSVCSEILEKVSFLRKSNSMVAADDSFLATRCTRSLFPEIPEKKTLLPKKSCSNLVENPSSLPTHDTRSVCLEISEKKTPTVKRSNIASSLRFSDTRSICSEIPEKRSLPPGKSNSVRDKKDPGKAREPTTRPFSNPQARSVRITTERRVAPSLRQCKCRPMPAGHSGSSRDAIEVSSVKLSVCFIVGDSSIVVIDHISRYSIGGAKQMGSDWHWEREGTTTMKQREYRTRAAAIAAAVAVAAAAAAVACRHWSSPEKWKSGLVIVADPVGGHSNSNTTKLHQRQAAKPTLLYCPLTDILP